MISITDKKSKAGRSVPAFYIQRFVCHRTICELNRMKQAENRRAKVLDISEEKLDERILRDFSENKNKALKNILKVGVNRKWHTKQKNLVTMQNEERSQKLRTP